MDSAELIDSDGSSILYINELLRVESTVFLENHVLVGRDGSTVEISGGANATFDSQGGAATAADLETLGYGFPETPGHNYFTANGGMRLRGDVSKIASLEGVGSDLLLFVSFGDFEIESRIHNEASGWDSSGVDLYLSSLQYVPGYTVEAIAPDFDGIWFADSPCIKPWRNLTVICLADSGIDCEPRSLVDDVKNSLPLDVSWPEAVYVDGDVTVGTRAVVDPDTIKIYHTGALTGTVRGTNAVQVEKTLYGDFNGDCAMTPVEWVPLAQIIYGVNPYDPLYDFDCDGVINEAVEKEQWFYNYYYGEIPCAPEEAQGESGSILTAAELGALADWIAPNMTSDELSAFIARTRAKAEDHSGTPLGQELMVTADALAAWK